MQPQPPRLLIRQSQFSSDQAIAATISGLMSAAIGQSFHQAAESPGHHQQTRELTTALPAIRAEKIATASQSRNEPAATPMASAPMTWPQTNGWMRLTVRSA